MEYVAYLTSNARRDIVLQALAKTGRVELLQPDAYAFTPEPIPLIFGLGLEVLPIIRHRLQRKLPFLFCDHAYFLRAKQWRREHGKYHTGAWFRLCANGLNQTQFDTVRPADRWNRLVELGVPAVGEVTHQKTGEEILLCPPNTVQYVYDLGRWEEATRAAIATHTSRPVRVRYKNDPTPLEDDLAASWGVVTFQSTVAIHALLAGKPIWCDESCCAYNLSNGTQYELLDDPYFPPNDDIHTWLHQLAYGQFTIDEYASGLALDTVTPLLE